MSRSCMDLNQERHRSGDLQDLLMGNPLHHSAPYNHRPHFALHFINAALPLAARVACAALSDAFGN
jgi:hypothetical protein